MTAPMTAGPIIIMLLVTVQRLSELVIDRRNRAALLVQGAQEHGRGHYPWMVLLHVGWLAGLWGTALWTSQWNPETGIASVRPVDPVWLALFLVMQALRLWVQVTLGQRWTTRILVLRAEPPVCSGPYRFTHHPNYLAVAVEIAALPLAFGMAGYALVFSILNGAMLAVRIRAEDRALGRRPGRPSTPVKTIRGGRV
ncbi:isoprenylcysteine carboxyl methyltransferase family protein [Azospirillum endophyticum]|nr:isoprenylcysteine carboxylmethyltransferase family protein [Azospirillum endophyticum]